MTYSVWLSLLFVACSAIPTPKSGNKNESDRSAQVANDGESGETSDLDSDGDDEADQENSEKSSSDIVETSENSQSDGDDDIADSTEQQGEPSASPSPDPSPSASSVPSRLAGAFGGRLMTAYISTEGKLYLSGGYNPTLGVTSEKICFTLNLVRCEPKLKLMSDTLSFVHVSLPKEFSSTALAAGSDGFAYAWGSNFYGEVSFDLTQKPTTPIKVVGPTNIVSVTMNRNYSLALDKDGGVWEWGADWMRITNGTIVPDKRIAPRKVAGLPSASAIRGAGGASFALTKDGKVFHWGQVSSRRIADVDVINRIPKEVTGLTEVVDLKISGQYLAVNKGGNVYAWGFGGAGSLGLGDLLDRTIPTKIDGLSDVVEVFTQDLTSFAITKSGALYVWGAYRYAYPPVEGAVDCGAQFQKCILKPTLVPNFPAVQKASCGSLHCVGYSADKKQWVGFGNRYLGVFGNGTYDDQFVGITELGNP